MLSGGELQRVAIAAAISRDADVYIFDEPSSHLDVYQRVRAARSIRKLVEDGKSVLVAEHDLAMLDYLSDEVYLVYGQPGAYGIVSHVHPTRSGINDYLLGFLADENMRFRDEPIRFHVRPPRQINFEAGNQTRMARNYQDRRKLRSERRTGIAQSWRDSRNIRAKRHRKNNIHQRTSRLLHKIFQNQLQVSYKPQYISTDYDGTVDQLLASVANDTSSLFTEEVIRPLSINKLWKEKYLSLAGANSRESL